ncbi:hypothetical protein [Bradyrhizobium sp.]|jgi:hypothetical protein|uniref:hypothetical protein n=1 Tax=Bradyrhizobium sp. TaxID=376 RepID=UPI002E001A77|nr:hypothetical protein [Bradyrhizobium sp.]
MRSRYLRWSLQLIAFVLFISAAAAQMAPTEPAAIDWKAAIEEYKNQAGDNLAALRNIPSIKEQVARGRAVDGLNPDTQQDLATINALIFPIRPKIAFAGSPVLLPFDVRKLSDDFLRTGSSQGAEKSAVYFGKFKSLAFHPGPYGYRAYFGLKNSSTVMVSGSSLFYKIPSIDPLPPLKPCADFIADARKASSNANARNNSFKDLEQYERDIGETGAGNFRDIEAAVPCTFAGALVEVNILCDEVGDPDCHVKDLALEIIARLTFVGGAPRGQQTAKVNDPIQRLGKEVNDLANAVKSSGKAMKIYGDPGDIIPFSGVKGAGGSKDSNVYGPILFPTDMSAVGQTVVYRIHEECQEGETDGGTSCKTPDGFTIAKSAPDEWRDNFCEMRATGTLFTCPEGKGHAGQDMWGEKWKDSTIKHPLRAALDAIAFRRFPTQPAVTLSDVNGSNIDYIYRHMKPTELDAIIGTAGPHEVKRGCILAHADRLMRVEKNGPLSDGNVRFGATAIHLHFEIRVPTRAGYQNVSPYQTIVHAHRASAAGVDTSKAENGRCAKS